MKKLLFIPCFLLMVIQGFSQQKSMYYENLQNEYDYSGKLHNEYLEHAKGFISPNSTHQEISSILEQKVRTEFNGSNQQINSIINQLTNCCTAQRCQFDSNQVSKNVQDLYSEIQSITENAESNSDGLIYIINEIKELEETINRNKVLTDQEKQLLLSLTSITRHSYYYWFHNADEWAQQCGTPTLRGFNWKSLGKADLEAGGAGAVGAAVVGGTVSVGTLTVPAAVAGGIAGAVGGSAGNAISQWLF